MKKKNKKKTKGLHGIEYIKKTNERNIGDIKKET